MRTFPCPCGNRLHFENSVCLACQAPVIYNPESDRFEAGSVEVAPCSNRDLIGCNWARSASSLDGMCVSCAGTSRIPSLLDPKNVVRFAAFESAKRRMLRTLISTGLWHSDGSGSSGYGTPLTFELLETLPGGPEVMTGHRDGIVTLNVLEADADQRERMRDRLGEPYRTLLGHLRHEVGHYYWDVLIRDLAPLEEFRTLFGDDREDYASAMSRHYEQGAPADWPFRYISAYATMHAWEDWAETWAHFMHRHDTLETAFEFGLEWGEIPASVAIDSLVGIAGSTREEAETFAKDSERWLQTIVMANELSRSMGQPDVYPFVPSDEAMKKLFFVQRIATGQIAA